jgi:hypothetical protein
VTVDFDALVLAPCERAFGESVTYLAGDGRSYTIAGIFNDRFAETKYQDGQELRSTHPMVSIRASQVTQQPAQGELFRIRGVLYAVTNTDPDGFGDLRIHLRFASDQEALRTSLPPG